jgi:nitroimidazol reductase NimA-like FMN-containing flavoprotein (pyridoxamine 5'-phosphate oxidase superfamily)
MVIHEMSKEECLNTVKRSRVARLACALENQPYVVPIYYAYHKATDGESYLYGFTTQGQKVEWMRANPLVCVEWDEVTNYDRWESVIVFGKYEELSDTSEGGQAQQQTRAPLRATTMLDESDEKQEWQRAHELLREHTTWWQPGWAAFAASDHRDHTQPFKPLYYRIHIDQITGHRASRNDAENAESVASSQDHGNEGWLRKLVRSVTGNTSR